MLRFCEYIELSHWCHSTLQWNCEVETIVGKSQRQGLLGSNLNQQAQILIHNFFSPCSQCTALYNSFLMILIDFNFSVFLFFGVVPVLMCNSPDLTPWTLRCWYSPHLYHRASWENTIVLRGRSHIPFRCVVVQPWTAVSLRWLFKINSWW